MFQQRGNKIFDLRVFQEAPTHRHRRSRQRGGYTQIRHVLAMWPRDLGSKHLAAQNEQCTCNSPDAPAPLHAGHIYAHNITRESSALCRPIDHGALHTIQTSNALLRDPASAGLLACRHDAHPQLHIRATPLGQHPGDGSAARSRRNPVPKNRSLVGSLVGRMDCVNHTALPLDWSPPSPR